MKIKWGGIRGRNHVIQKTEENKKRTPRPLTDPEYNDHCRCESECVVKVAIEKCNCFPLEIGGNKAEEWWEKKICTLLKSVIKNVLHTSCKKEK